MLAAAVGHDRKGKISPIFYILAIPAAFVNTAISGALYVTVALIWLLPDKRIERVVAAGEGMKGSEDTGQQRGGGAEKRQTHKNAMP